MVGDRTPAVRPRTSSLKQRTPPVISTSWSKAKDSNAESRTRLRPPPQCSGHSTCRSQRTPTPHRPPPGPPVSSRRRRPPAESSSTSDSMRPRPRPTARTSPQSPLSGRPTPRNSPARPRPRPSSPWHRKPAAAISTPCEPGPTAPPPPPAHRRRHTAPRVPRRTDRPRREVRIDGDLVDVTTKEFDLLATLVSHADETLPREDLITAVWSGDEVPDDRTVDVHIRRLRRRLGDYASVVRTMRRSGYRYDTHPAETVWPDFPVKIVDR
ncbi:Transcriptional regulatory protein, C terminal [Brevibacterium aurantiacum]|uniref:Transcriptional regulatory protein, C terminal n=1 Tax=Brevibacterium aurantiacum TaxID=273384 RepID=A0A2H1L0N2_BREAU|nr:Transcriptional regulatory protein, C terminal [Brevibacterium aurantiacum]